VFLVIVADSKDCGASEEEGKEEGKEEVGGAFNLRISVMPSMQSKTVLMFTPLIVLLIMSTTNGILERNESEWSLVEEREAR
jgi:hypothetical protein